MIAIIDYGVGNLFSLKSSLKQLGLEAVVTADADTIRKADRLILPGVGAFADAMAKLVEQFNAGEIATVFQNVGYNQLYLASLVNENPLPAITAALGEGTRVFVMNFDFLGLDLAMLPTWKIWEHLNWQYIGAFLLIVISAFSSIFMSKISMKTNQMNNQSGNEQVEKTNRIMMWTMPLMSLWIGFMMPVAMCVYWIANSLFSVIQELIAGKILKKDYEAARAAAAERERM